MQCCKMLSVLLKNNTLLLITEICIQYILQILRLVSFNTSLLYCYAFLNKLCVSKFRSEIINIWFRAQFYFSHCYLPLLFLGLEHCLQFYHETEKLWYFNLIQFQNSLPTWRTGKIIREYFMKNYFSNITINPLFYV